VDCRALDADGWTEEYLLVVLILVGGFSTNEVSVVRKVASVVSAPARSRKGESASCWEEGVSFCRAKDWGMGA